MKCNEDEKFVEREWIFEFLIGLNVEFDQVRVQVLGKEKLNEVISMIHAEEGRRGVMFKLSSIDGFAIVVAKPKKFSPNPVRETQCFEGSKNLTMKNFSVLIAWSLDTPKTSVGNFMENFKTWIGMRKIKHGSNTIK